MVDRFKSDYITNPPRDLILIDVFYHSLLFLGHYILLDGFKLGEDIFTCWKWTPKFLGAELTESSSWNAAMNSEWRFR